MVRRGLGACIVATLFSATTAAAAGGGTATATLTPAKAGAAPAASVTLTGPFSTSTGVPLTGVPTSIALAVQKGFTSTALKAVTALCTKAEAGSSTGCPAGSQIGTGTVTATLAGTPLSVPATLYMGPPLESGDIASVELIGHALGQTLTAPARLFTPSGGGVELLLTGLPQLPITLDSVALTAHATQTGTITKIEHKTKIKFTGTGKNRKKHKIKVKVGVKVKVTYSLLTNPPTCTGQWTGSVTMIFPSGTFSAPLTVPCTK